MKRTGRCLCGAVSFEISKSDAHIGACHCSMCRRHSGGVFIGLRVSESDISFHGEDQLARYTSSDWAERAFCKTCGSTLFYRVTLDGPMKGEHHVGIGTLDDPSGLPLTQELFIDLKPDGYSFAEKTQALTTEQVEELFSDV